MRKHALPSTFGQHVSIRSGQVVPVVGELASAEQQHEVVHAPEEESEGPPARLDDEERDEWAERPHEPPCPQRQVVDDHRVGRSGEGESNGLAATHEQ